MEQVTVDCATGETSRTTLKAPAVADIARIAAELVATQERADRLAALRAKGAASMTPAERNEALDLLLAG